MSRLGVLLVAGLLAASTASARQDVDRRLPAKARGAVEIEVPAGSLRLVAHDRGEIHVRGRLGDGVEALGVTAEGRWTRLRVRVPRPVDNAPRPGLGSDLEIALPAGSEVTVRGLATRVEAAGLSGRLSVETTTGGVDVTGAPRSLRVRTVSGDVALDVRAEEVWVEGVAGRVEVAGDVEDLRAEVVDGPLVVSARLRHEGVLGTAVGPLRFAGGLDATARLRLRSSGGEVAVVVPTAADVRVESFGGSLDNAFGESWAAAAGERRETAFTVGDGGPDLEVEAFGAPVRLERR